MKKILATILAAIIIVFSVNAYAASDSIDSIDIKATLMDDGALMVTEVWKATPMTGTEFYIPKTNMRDIVIADFKVSDESGQYETVNNWNVDASFDEKASKCGINETSDGIELCFGKSDLNKNKTYTLTYTMRNAAQSFDDMDGFNIRFVNDQMDPAPNKVSFELSLANGEINEGKARVWGFGSSADIVFEGGKVIVHEINDFGPANHLTVLFGLNKGVINPISMGSGSFEDMKERAMQGSDYYDREEDIQVEDNNEDNEDDFYYPDYNTGNNFNNVFFVRNPIVIPIIFIFIASIISMIVSGVKKSRISSENSLPKDVNYWRDLPMNGNILLNSGIYSVNESLSVTNVVAAYFLKWIKDGNIELVKEKFTKGLIFKKDVLEDCFKIIKAPETEDVMEEQLYKLITAVSGDDLVLRNDELVRAFNRGSVAENFVKNYNKNASSAAERLNLVYKKPGFLLSSYDVFTERGREEAIKQKGFIKFLKDFTLINEREAVEVALWDEYLVLAALFGLGEKVLEKFKSLDPSYTYAGYTGLDPVLMYRVVNNIGTSVNHAYQSNRSSSASHGGGGGMSFGGGGGFSGGGSGGGGR
ncbi:DUF2207 family protein [uncultured Fenollaria sp.]|uniref:DUF2207 family protein n=1 Tax=uncultured Fenollaria sp. TaxID=1686315 RepID=UPI0025D451B8|nr:DUF2207 domain-containing protein [uncultured Fenollaria sp.]